MSDALDGEIQPIARNPLRAWVRVTLHKLDATIAARRLVQGLSSGAFSEAVAAGLESVTVAFDAKTLTLIGVEMAVREVRDFLQKIDMVEIDEIVVKLCLKHIPSIAGRASCDQRVNFIFKDGIEYIKDKNNMYDVIIIDSSDPVGPAEGLFTESFYLNAKKCLKPNGVFACQSQSPLFYRDITNRTYKILSKHFAIVKIYIATVPSYPGGFWSFTIASDCYDPDKADVSRLSDNTRYINREVFHSSFKLPNFIKQIINQA